MIKKSGSSTVQTPKVAKKTNGSFIVGSTCTVSNLQKPMKEGFQVWIPFLLT